MKTQIEKLEKIKESVKDQALKDSLKEKIKVLKGNKTVKK